MTGRTALIAGREPAREVVAGVTGQRDSIITNLVPDKAEARPVMVKFAQRGCNRIKPSALVVGVAIAALLSRRDLRVGSPPGLYLCLDARMAAQTQLRLRGRQRLVAQAASPFELGMRVKAQNGFAL